VTALSRGQRKAPGRGSSHGGRYYRAHRELELARKSVGRARLDSAHRAFRAAHTDYSGSKRDFARLLREKGWVIPSHSRRGHPSAAVLEAERRFVEEGLGRSGRYTTPRYPFAGADEWEIT
jgi:hypothetical protein